MGRETKLLLALLGLLAGVFLGVVSMKLFVPRPPAGAGPDVHGDIASAEAQMLVEPPELDPPAVPAHSAVAAPQPLPPDADSPIEQASPVSSSRFGGADAARDPFVVAASYEQTEPAAEPTPASPPESESPAEPAPPADLLPPSDLLPPAHSQPQAELLPPPSFERAAPPPAAPLGQTYVAQTGDSWWSLAERAYGDGRLYRALFAWNRMIDPRVSLAPGTRLEIPPAAKLGASWPGLLPRD